MWEQLHYTVKLRILEAESTVAVALLLEDEGLVNLIRQGTSKEACLTYINENW